MTSYQKEGQLPRYRSNSSGSRSSMEARAPYSADYADAEAATQSSVFDVLEAQEYDEPTLSRPTFVSQSQSHGRPLIEYVKNEWRTNPKFGQVYSSSDERPAKKTRMLLSVLAAPKVRRYILVYLLLVLACWASWRSFLGPHWNEQRVLARSLNVKMKSGNGWFGTNARPEFTDMVHLKTLNSKLLPSDKPHGKSSGKRLVVVGDVHGCKKELVELLDKISFTPKNDHLILLGDMITKGPDSLGVIDLARDIHASCVRGNHEDRILLIHRDLSSSLQPLKGPRGSVDHSEKDMMDEESFSRGDYESRRLAKKLTDKQVEYLKTCPVILKIGNFANMGEVVTVHAGLVPGVDLEKQDPAGVMNMRTIDLETHVPSKDPKGGKPWAKLWNKYQSLLPTNTAHSTVLYGHDSHRGLSLSKYTKGLDTGCVKGGKLTAMVISDGGKSKFVSVKCKDHRPKRPLTASVEDVLRDGRVSKVKGTGSEDDEDA